MMICKCLEEFYFFLEFRNVLQPRIENSSDWVQTEEEGVQSAREISRIGQTKFTHFGQCEDCNGRIRDVPSSGKKMHNCCHL